MPSVPPPAPGKGNLVGRVGYDGEPAAGIEVQLCGKFDELLGQICDGSTRVAVTDASGTYVFRDVPPGTYGALLVHVFDSDEWVFMHRTTTAGGLKALIPGAQSHEIRAGQSQVVETMDITRSDLEIRFPRAGARAAATTAIRWAAYPGASSYHVTVQRRNDDGDVEAGSAITQDVKTTSLELTAPLAPGRWEVTVDAKSAKTGAAIAHGRSPIVFIVPEPSDSEPIDTTECAPRQPPPPLPKLEPAPRKPSTGAVQGLVLFDGAPAKGIEVKLCERFDALGGTGCYGAVLTTRTDARGAYAFSDVAPKEYGAITVRVFQTADLLYESGMIGAKKYTVDADLTLPVLPFHLYRSDLRVLAPPPPNARVGKDRFEIKWAPYPRAVAYELSIHDQKRGSAAPGYRDLRVSQPRFMLDRPLANGEYAINVTALNAWGHRLGRSGASIVTVAAK